MRGPAVIGVVVAIAASHAAVAAPALDHAFGAPTAWLPEPGAGVVAAALDHHGDGKFELGYVLGGLAEVELGVDSDTRACGPCSHDDPAPTIYLARAAFRMAAREDVWFRGQPALVLGVRTTSDLGAAANHRKANEAYVVASRHLDFATLHAGVAVHAATAMTTRVRPIVAAELTPPIYPKSTLVASLVWAPRFEPAAPQLEYVFDWGVRYQTFSWASVELDVRHREAELGSPTVMVRVNGVWSP